MDEDDNDHEKTQIWLPGGALPPKPRNPSAVEHEMLLKPARKAAADTAAVDFDITTGAESPKARPREQTATGRKAAPAAPVRSAPEKSSTGLVATIALIVLVVVVGFVLTR